MPSIKKKIVVNETQQPVAVIIDYQDWKWIEAMLQQQENVQSEQDNSERLRVYAGCIRLTIDPLQYQQEVRDTWF